MTWIDVVGFIGTALTIITYSLSTMIPLRIFSIAANSTFLFYGYWTESPPLIVMSALLVPLNAWRLIEMIKLARDAEVASASDLSMGWLQPYGRSVSFTPEEEVFRKGDKANAMYVIQSGRFRLVQSGIELNPGDVVGELGLLSPDNARTQGVTCVDGGRMLRIGYSDLKQLHYQNPRFGYYLLRLVSKRLFQNLERAERDAKTG